MKHLDELALVDVIEGRADVASMAHLSVCADCREQVDTLGGVLRSVTGGEVPEPSPLFWGHLQARVAAAIDAPETPGRWRTGGAFGWLTAGSLAATLTLLLLTSPAVRSRIDGAAVTTPPVALADVAEVDDLDADEAWALVRDIADELDYETAREIGVAPAPGSLERAAAELSPAERTALIQLIEEEMKRTDS